MVQVFFRVVQKFTPPEFDNPALVTDAVVMMIYALTDVDDVEAGAVLLSARASNVAMFFALRSRLVVTAADAVRMGAIARPAAVTSSARGGGLDPRGPDVSGFCNVSTQVPAEADWRANRPCSSTPRELELERAAAPEGTAAKSREETPLWGLRVAARSTTTESDDVSSSAAIKVAASSLNTGTPPAPLADKETDGAGDPASGTSENGFGSDHDGDAPTMTIRGAVR